MNFEGSIVQWKEPTQSPHGLREGDEIPIVITPAIPDLGLPARFIRWLGRLIHSERLRRFRWGFEYYGQVKIKEIRESRQWDEELQSMVPVQIFEYEGIDKLNRRRIPSGKTFP